MTTDKAIPPLSDAHRRGITMTLLILDEMLCSFEDWANGREHRSALYQEHNDLSPQQRRAILAEVEQMRALLRSARDELRLEGRSESASTCIWSQCSGVWEHVVELQGRYLRRYGDPPPELTEFLDPIAAALVEHLERLSAAARHTSPRSQGQAANEV